MPTCSRCTATVADSDRFCSRCGAPSEGVQASVLPTIAPSAARPAPSSTGSDPSSLGHGRFEPGTRLGSRYRIVGMLGKGGMGEVYRADDLELGQAVALKFLPERLRHDAEMLARFRAEVRLARQVAHPNVARVYDIGEADGHVFLSMEYVDGEDLASVLRRMGRPSRDKAVEITRQMVMGLAAAHERGVLHRDLKPANVMIDGRGRVRIMDFGLAALADAASEDLAIVGTPAYMAPEQRATGQVSVQSDLYSLGLVLYELFTGKRATENRAKTPSSVHDLSDSIPTPSTVIDDMDPAIERVVMRCLEEDPRLRPSSAYAMLGALPGGDPLAAAIAAGETPSPELVANAGASGGLSPRVGLLVLAAVLGCTVLSTVLASATFRMIQEGPDALGFQAASMLKSFGYDPLPSHTAMGFSFRSEIVERLKKRRLPADSLTTLGPGAAFFWRRFSDQRLEPLNVHSSIVRLADPPQSGAGSVSALLDGDGKLIGLQAIAPPDSAHGRASVAARWPALLAAAAIAPAALAPDTGAWSPPVASDTVAAWTLADPRALGGRVTVRAAAYRGRPVYFAIEDSLGSATGGVQPPVDSSDGGAAAWVSFLLWSGMQIASVVLGLRNLRLGRVDRRGATRLGIVVLVATALESVFVWRLPEDGPRDLIGNLLSDRPLGHGLIHAAEMWFAYVAIEPYVRRIWPRMLVSWARLASGRWRDPMVGRDVLAGMLLGTGGNVLGVSAFHLAARLHLKSSPLLLDVTSFSSTATYGGLASSVAYNLSVAVLVVLSTLVMCLLTHFFVKRDAGTMVVAGMLTALAYSPASFFGGDFGQVAISVFVATVLMIALFRFGLLTALATVFTAYIIGVAPPAFDANAWYVGRGMLMLALFTAIAGVSAWSAMAGHSMLPDATPANRPSR